jgi:hypothetical protein
MLLAQLKPNASLKTRIFLAALLWSCIGLMLIGRGVMAISGSGNEWLILVALLLGFAKSSAILDRVAVKNMVRIFEKGEYSCLGGIYSWKTWALVVVMIISGKLLRSSPLPVWLVGALYVAVGWGLFWSSRKVWSRLRNISKHGSSETKDEQLP